MVTSESGEVVRRIAVLWPTTAPALLGEIVLALAGVDVSPGDADGILSAMFMVNSRFFEMSEFASRAAALKPAVDPMSLGNSPERQAIERAQKLREWEENRFDVDGARVKLALMPAVALYELKEAFLATLEQRHRASYRGMLDAGRYPIAFVVFAYGSGVLAA